MPVVVVVVIVVYCFLFVSNIRQKYISIAFSREIEQNICMCVCIET